MNSCWTTTYLTSNIGNRLLASLYSRTSITCLGDIALKVSAYNGPMGITAIFTVAVTKEIPTQHFALYPFPGHAPPLASYSHYTATPTASDSNLLANHDLGSVRDSQTREGRPGQSLTSIDTLCSNLEPVFTPPALRKGSVCRHVTSPGEHDRNRVTAPYLLYSHTLRGGMRSLYHSIGSCNGRKSHLHSVPAPCRRICYPSFASGACVLWNALGTWEAYLAFRST